jgi:hypothetical protein
MRNFKLFFSCDGLEKWGIQLGAVMLELRNGIKEIASEI